MAIEPVRPPTAILIYLGTVFLGAAALAPWVYQCVQALAKGFPSIEPLARQPFHRYVNRSLLGLAILGLPWLGRRCGITGASSLGWTTWGPHRRAVMEGLWISWASLGVAAGLALMLGARAVRDDVFRDIAWALARAGASAVVVAVIEETLFRGLLLGALRRTLSPRIALAGSAALYAIVHFFRKPQSPGIIDAWSGWITLGSMCSGFFEPRVLWPGFVSLVIVGWILGHTFLRTRSLWPSVALHAGWIFWLKGYGRWTRPTGDGPSLWWGSDRLYDGVVALVCLLAAGWIIRRRVGQSRPTSGMRP